MKRAGAVSLTAVLLLSTAAFAVPVERDEAERAAARPGGALRAVALLEHAPGDAEKAALAAMGVEIVQATGRDRLIVRGSDEALASARREGLIRSAERIAPEQRIHSSALRELSRRGGAAKIAVAFHADVAVEEALEVIRTAGGWTADPFVLRFALANTIDVWATPDVVTALSQRDQVLRIVGRDTFVKSDNVAAANLSNVTPLFSPPYGLTGAGITVSVLDVGLVQADHPEFGGRVTVHSQGKVDRHPTHVTGTIAAQGIQFGAKGMAPAVRVHQFSHGDGINKFLEKYEQFPLLSVAADNNSWGYITGWDYDSTKSQWGWYRNTSFGGYSSVSAAVDYIVRDRGTLIMFSAGNEGGDAGPTTEWREHTHPYEDDDKAVWCISKDASGGDCPVTPCGTRCEKENHPSDGTFRNVGQTGSSKNVLTVGAVNSQKAIASFSSRGPTRDGRIKPDIVAKGVSQYSTIEGSSYSNLQGTSMATPVVTGISALLLEQWHRSMGPIGPTPDVLKALLIHGATDLGNPGPDFTFGFGLVDAKASVDTVIADSGSGSRFRRGALRSGESQEFPFQLGAGANVKLTIVWTDPENVPYPENEMTLIDDMDLEVIAPDGSKILPWVLNAEDPEAPATRGVNDIDTVEQVEFTATQAGAYRAVVRATSVPGLGYQEFAIVSNVDLEAPQSGCFDPHEPNDTPDRAWSRLISARSYSSRLCTSSDVDHFRFPVDVAGTVSLQVTAGASAPVKVTLTGEGVPPMSATVAAGQTSSLSLHEPAGGGAVYVVKIEPAGAFTGETAYSMTATYGSTQPSRQRTARRGDQ